MSFLTQIMSSAQIILYPKLQRFFQEIYEETTRIPSSYLLVDIKNDAGKRIHLWIQIVHGETQFEHVE